MTNPVVVACPKEEWTKVATAVQSGWLHLQEPDLNLDVSFFTWVDTTGTAPTIAPLAAGNAAVQFEKRSTPINVTPAADVYVWALKDDVSVLVSAQ